MWVKPVAENPNLQAPVCGHMSTHHESLPFLTKTCFHIKHAYYLCEFPPTALISSGSQKDNENVIQLPNARENPVYNFSTVQCPDKRWTHAFLACDQSSACWARDDVLLEYSPDDWLAVASAWCDAPGLTSGDSYFLCRSRSERVPFTLVCDFHPDCFDKSDEEFCVLPPCTMDKLLQCGATAQVCVCVTRACL